MAVGEWRWEESRAVNAWHEKMTFTGSLGKRLKSNGVSAHGQDDCCFFLRFAFMGRVVNEVIRTPKAAG